MFLIKVTQRHIDEGLCGDLVKCMAALALAEASGLSVLVGPWDVTFEYPIGGGSFNVDLPKRVQKKIVLFDNGRTVKPFSFRL